MRREQGVLRLMDPNLVAKGDSYHFGVYAGVGLKRLVPLMRRLRCLPRRLWGFDTFAGFPDTPEDQLGKYGAHGFDVREKLGIKNPQDAMEAVEKSINSPEVTLLRGAFEDVLTPELVWIARMQPACLVDMDCDLYKGASDALHWMRREGLLVPGTIIYYDDWDAFPEYEGGESLAHKETVADICDEVWRTEHTGHVKVVFRVREEC